MFLFTILLVRRKWRFFLVAEEVFGFVCLLHLPKVLRSLWGYYYFDYPQDVFLFDWVQTLNLYLLCFLWSCCFFIGPHGFRACSTIWSKATLYIRGLRTLGSYDILPHSLFLPFTKAYNLLSRSWGVKVNPLEFCGFVDFTTVNQASQLCLFLCVFCWYCFC